MDVLKLLIYNRTCPVDNTGYRYWKSVSITPKICFASSSLGLLHNLSLLKMSGCPTAQYIISNLLRICNTLILYQPYFEYASIFNEALTRDCSRICGCKVIVNIEYSFRINPIPSASCGSTSMVS